MDRAPAKFIIAHGTKALSVHEELLARIQWLGEGFRRWSETPTGDPE
jgi:hypothetical protein